MGRGKRARPSKLARKLLQIRKQLDLSQSEMVLKLNVRQVDDRSTISGYERGEWEPPLPVLLRYARLAGISTDILIDDALKLPRKR